MFIITCMEWPSVSKYCVPKFFPVEPWNKKRGRVGGRGGCCPLYIPNKEWKVKARQTYTENYPKLGIKPIVSSNSVTNFVSEADIKRSLFLLEKNWDTEKFTNLIISDAELKFKVESFWFQHVFPPSVLSVVNLLHMVELLCKVEKIIWNSPLSKSGW